MKIAIVTDAWYPQINGVTRTIGMTVETLTRRGNDVRVLGPDSFRTIPLPTYSEIRIALAAGAGVRRFLDDFGADAIHLATEGPLGWAARRYCLKRRLPFTTSYHTRFPEYVAERAPIPLSWSYALLRRFHAPSSAIMVSTPAMERTLTGHGFRNLRRWTRGVDTDLFRPRINEPGWHPPIDLPRPIALYVGRVAVEKNLRAFLDMPFAGSKCVVGGGPQLESLKAEYPDVLFTGPKGGEDLAQHYASGDVFVFPSRTDTFGLVMLEALACGVPVAAYPVPGPIDVIGETGVGCLGEDLGAAAERALTLDRTQCRDHALTFSWEAAADQFLSGLHPLPDEPVPSAPQTI